MQPNNQSNKQYSDNPFFASTDEQNEGVRSFAEVVSSDEEDDNIGNIFNQGNMLLRNEESAFVPEDVGSLEDGDFKSQSDSSEEPVTKPQQPYSQGDIVRQTPASQPTRYGELITASLDMHQRHTPFMPVYSQEDDEEVELNPRHMHIGNQLSGRHSGVSEDDFYGGPQYSQAPRLFQHDMYGYPNLSQSSQPDLHNINFQHSQSHFLHSRQYANDQYFYKTEDRSLASHGGYSQSKQTLSQSQKQEQGQDAVQPEYICASYKQSVYPKRRLPSDVGECMVDDQAPYAERELSEAKLLKINGVGDEPSNQASHLELSKSIKAYNINNESSATMEFRNSQAQPQRKPAQNKSGKPVTGKHLPTMPEKSLRSQASNLQQIRPPPGRLRTLKMTPQTRTRPKDQDQSEDKSEIDESASKDAQTQFKLVKGKRRNARERKFFEKRRKQIESVYPSIKELGTVEWDNLIMKLSKMSAEQDTEKLNPYNSFNTSSFWYYVSSMYFPKCYDANLKERLCILVSLMRSDTTQKNWEKTFKDHPTFIRKSYRVLISTRKRLNRHLLKVKDAKKSKDQKKLPKERNPTEIEDLICQLKDYHEECAFNVDYMVCKLLDQIKSKKRPRLDLASDESQVRNLISKNSQCQQAIRFYQELNNFTSKQTLDYIALEEARYSEIKAQMLAKLREQYQRQRAEGNTDYIMCEPIGKSFLGMLRHNYETCYICNSDEYDVYNPKLQCSACEYIVHAECLGETPQTSSAETDAASFEISWTCQSCLVDQGLRKKFPGVDVSFKPECVFCGLTGGLMRATTTVLPDVRKTPGCNQITQWSASSTNGITISNLTRKEKDYQIKLTDAKIKTWQEKNQEKPFPPMKEKLDLQSQDSDSLVTLPDIDLQLAPSYVYWVHMSCSQWLMQKNLVKKKPVTLKSIPNQVDSIDGDKCEICSRSIGVLQQCTYSKVRQGEDKMLESLYQDLAQDESLDVNRDQVAGEYLDQLIEGGLCDNISHPSVNSKYNKGCTIDVCLNKMHIECARRAEYHMKYDPEIDSTEFYCSHHTPLPLKIELKDSLEEQIKSITEFAESYQNILKESPMLLEWTDKEKQELCSVVAETFFQMSKLSVDIQQASDGLMSVIEPAENLEKQDVGLLPGNQDWHITLNYNKFPWNQITVDDHDSIDCWKKYWEIIGLSESRFRQSVIGSSKKNMAKYIRFVKLRQQKILNDTKEKSQKAKVTPTEIVSPKSETQAKPVQQPEIAVQEEPKQQEETPLIPLSQEQPKKQKKKLTLRISPPSSQQVPVESRTLRPRPDRSQQTVSKQSPKATLLPKVESFIPIAEAKEAEKIIEPAPVEKKDEKPQKENDLSTIRRLKHIQKLKVKLEDKYSQFSKIISCYCHCPLSKMLEQKTLKISQNREGGSKVYEAPTTHPKFNNKEQEQHYLDCINNSSTKYSKSGVFRCSRKDECELGGYFHVECGYNSEPKFDIKKKARDKWFCLKCRVKFQKLPKLTSSPAKSPVKAKVESEQQLKEEVTDLLQVSPVKEITVIEEEKSPAILERRSSTRISKLKKPEPDAPKPALKRPKLDESLTLEVKLESSETLKPIAVETALENEPIILIQEQPKTMAKEAVGEQVNKKPKKELRIKDQLHGVPLIEDLIKKVEKVESTLPIETSQQHQSAFLQLKKAIQKYKISINAGPTTEAPKIEESPIKEHGEIEIKIEPVIKPVKQAPVKKAQVPIVTIIDKPENTDMFDESEKIAIAFDPRPEPVNLKLSLSQQFQINIQKKQQEMQQEQQTIQLPIEFKPDETIYVPIQLKIEKNPSHSSRHKKTKAEPDVKKFEPDPIIAQPVTIAYFAQTVARNEQTKSMQPQQRGSGSGSPPYQQNPLEPKLAAGPASGYPQQYNNQTQPTQITLTTNPQPEVYDPSRMSVLIEDERMQPTEEELAEIKRKLEKRERKRKRKEERIRREMENNLIHIETIQPAYPNASVISIMQPEASTLIQFQTEKPHKKLKKQKKPKEAGTDIVIDTQMPASMVSIANSFKLMMPAFDNQISIPTKQPVQLPVTQSVTPLYTIPTQPFYLPPADDFIISIPMGQKQPVTEVVLSMEDSKKKKKSLN